MFHKSRKIHEIKVSEKVRVIRYSVPNMIFHSPA